MRRLPSCVDHAGATRPGQACGLSDDEMHRVLPFYQRVDSIAQNNKPHCSALHLPMALFNKAAGIQCATGLARQDGGGGGGELEHDPEKSAAVFGKDHAPPTT